MVRYTEEEHLRIEESRPFRSEYVGGEIHPMADSTADHSLLLVGLGSALHAALRGRGCRVMSCQMKVWTPSGSIRYPDVCVLQGPSRYRVPDRTVITNPLLIVEVLSDSTQATDYGEKLREYQMLDSLQHYLIVSQREPRVELYTRKEEGHWDYVSVTGPGGALQLSALDVTLALVDIYEGIEFHADEGA